MNDFVELVLWREYDLYSEEGKVTIKMEDVSAVEGIHYQISCRIVLKCGEFWRVKESYKMVKKHLRDAGWSQA